MTTYLLESGLSLLVLLGVYKLWLEHQPMHQLKRVYLLGTLLLSLTGPLVSMQVPSGWAPFLSTVQLGDKQAYTSELVSDSSPVDKPATLVVGNVPGSNVPDSTAHTPYWLWVYGAITALMLLRFGRNLYVLACQIWTNQTEPHYGATLVKLPGNNLPYTFLQYLFVSADLYDRGDVEAELFTHEMAHIRQWHSLDVLLAEIVLCFSWFNPLVFWLKQTIQRNHEFLADEAVNETYLNVPGYQQLLINKLTVASPKLSLTSALTFQTTKQRLLMMTKQTSTARTWLAGCSTALFFTLLTVLLTGTAPGPKPIFPLKSEVTPRKPAPLLDVEELERRFGNAEVNSTSCDEKIDRHTKFKDLTPEQKTRVIYLHGRLPSTFSEEEFDALKNARRYSIWVDGKRIRHFERTNLKATDIVTYNIRRVYKHDRRPDLYFYQVDLLTDSAAVVHAKELQARPTLLLLTEEQMQRHRAMAAK